MYNTDNEDVGLRRNINSELKIIFFLHLTQPTIYMKLRYKIILYWSQEDQAFIAEVPELPGCAADGESYQEALQNVEIVMQEWIETAQELGRNIPQPKRGFMSA